MLDETALRRPDFQGGVSITLGDGQDWTFPEPVVEFIYAPSEKGYETQWSIGPEYGALLDAALAATEGPAVIRAELALTWALLTRNYDLTAAQFATLVRFRPHDEANRMTRHAILEVASGQAPKP